MYCRCEAQNMLQSRPNEFPPCPQATSTYCMATHIVHATWLTWPAIDRFGTCTLCSFSTNTGSLWCIGRCPTSTPHFLNECNATEHPANTIKITTCMRKYLETDLLIILRRVILHHLCLACESDWNGCAGSTYGGVHCARQYELSFVHSVQTEMSVNTGVLATPQIPQ